MINPSNSKLTKQIAISFPCYQIVMDPTGKTLYAIGEKISGQTVSFSIAVISTASNSLTKSFNAPDSTIRVSPWLAVSTDAKHLLLSASTGSGATSSSIDVVDPATEKLVDKVALSKGPSGQAIQGVQVWTQQ